MKNIGIDESVDSNHKRYRDFSKHLADSLWVVDATTLKVLFASDSTQELLGCGVEEITGSYLREITTEDSYQMAMIELTKARREFEMGKDPAPRLEIECYSRQSSTTWVEIAARFVREAGEPLQIVCIARGILNRKMADMNREHLLKMYMESLTEETRLRSTIELLEKLLPICSGCQQIRDDDNQWRPLEAYVREQTGSRMNTTLCPDCRKICSPRDRN